MYVVINFREKCADGHFADKSAADQAMWIWKKRYRHDDFYIYETEKDELHPLVMDERTFMPKCYRLHGVKI